MLYKAIIPLFIFTFLSLESLATENLAKESFLHEISEPEKLCVKYETRNGWSKGYHVDVNTLKGSELNRKTNSWDYNSYSTYAVIFWSNDQASVIELNYFIGSFSVHVTNGVDQRGRKWKLSKNSICY